MCVPLYEWVCVHRSKFVKVLVAEARFEGKAQDSRGPLAPNNIVYASVAGRCSGFRLGFSIMHFA